LWSEAPKDGRRRQIRPYGQGLFAAWNKYPGRQPTDSGFIDKLHKNSVKKPFFSPLFRCLALFIAFAGFVLMPEHVHAIQSHGGGEGLIIHQVAHIVFAVSMGGIAVRILRSPLARDRSWRYFSLGAVLLALWNIWAFTGHQLELEIPKDHFHIAQPDFAPYLEIHTTIDLLYYIYKMDHLISLPALFFFFRALKGMKGRFPG